MIALQGSEKSIETATKVRDDIALYLPQVLDAPHIPALNEQQKNKVLEKLVWTINNEDRATYYANVLWGAAAMRPGTTEKPTKITNTVLKWAGKISSPKYKEPKQKIPNAKNGRIIRDPKGL